MPMVATDVVRTARDRLGSVGAFLPVVLDTVTPADQQRDAARRLERAGYRSAWSNEGIGGKDVLVQLGMLLAATDRLVLGPAIANIWARQPETAHGGAALLADAYPGRFVLGLGVGYPQQAEMVGLSYGKPLATMRGYLSRMDTVPGPFPAPDVRYPRVLAAYGPKMLALAAELADGAWPNGVPVDHLAKARETLGPDKLLIAGMITVLDADRGRARETAREYLKAAVSRPNSPFAGNLLRLGYSEEDLVGPSDRVVDAVITYGDEAAIAKRLAEKLAAGADHVVAMPVRTDYPTGVATLETLGPALLEAAA